MSKFDDAIRMIRENADTAEGRAEIADALADALEDGVETDTTCGAILAALGKVKRAPDGKCWAVYLIRRSSRLAWRLRDAAHGGWRGWGPLAD